MSKSKAGVTAFLLACVCISIVQVERVSSAICLFVFEWVSVVSPFCELVASGMSSQRFERNTYIDFLPMIFYKRGEELDHG